LDQVSNAGIASPFVGAPSAAAALCAVEQCRSSVVGSPEHQLAEPDHQQWSPHNAQICAAGAERSIDAATAPNGGSGIETQVTVGNVTVAPAA